MLKTNEKLSIYFDTSGDQPELYPDGYYICVLLAHDGDGKWYNTGVVFHVASLNDVEAKLKLFGR